MQAGAFKWLQPSCHTRWWRRRLSKSVPEARQQTTLPTTKHSWTGAAKNLKMLDWQTLRGARPEDRLVDFSFAGCFKNERPLPSPYHQAGVNIENLQSTYDQRDRTADVCQSLERLSRRGGGVLQLSSGPFSLTSTATININTSRIVIQGDALGKQPTSLVIAGANRPVFTVGPQEPQKPKFDLRANILDPYVPVGAQAVKGKQLHLKGMCAYRI